MSDKMNGKDSFINNLVVKAIEKKKKREQAVERKKLPKLEYVLFSQFDVLDTIVSKKSGTVLYHLANRENPDRQICCKALSETASEDAAERLITEATTLELCQHPSIASFIKVGTEFETPYFMYEWGKGESLAQKVVRHANKGFRHDHIAWLIYQLAGALEYMHTRGYCHLDVKPSNILVCEDDSVKLIDFGAAQPIGLQSNRCEASLSYASPAYVQTGEAHPQDDVYSLAVITYHLFYGNAESSDWKTTLKSYQRSHRLPNHVWSLIREVILKPREHGYTPISFAQSLSRIDLSDKFLQTAPIFNSLRNADLVLTRFNPVEGGQLGAMRYLEITLMVAVVALVGVLMSRNLDPALSVVNQVRELPASGATDTDEAVKLFSQDPWSVRRAVLQAENEDSLTVEKFSDLYSIQQDISRSNYQELESQIQAQRDVIQSQPQKLSEIKRSLVAIQAELDKADFPGQEIDHQLASVVASLNELANNSYELGYVYGVPGETLADMVVEGEGESVEQYMKNAWAASQANAYFFSEVLPGQVKEEVIARADRLVEQKEYTKAIEEISRAMRYFSGDQQLAGVKDELIARRSEFILFNTAQGEKVFAPDKLKLALQDLENVSPERFAEVEEQLKKITASKLSSGYHKNSNAEGAMTIERVLEQYNSSRI